MTWEFLMDTKAPHVHVVQGNADELCDAVLGLDDLRDQGLVTRWLRGAKMRTSKGAFDEFAAALQFPPYFGENWDAFDECLNDLEWLDGQGAALFMLDADQLMQDAPPDDGRIFFEILQATESNVPFHIVLQSEEATTVMTGLKAMGIEANLMKA